MPSWQQKTKMQNRGGLSPGFLTPYLILVFNHLTASPSFPILAPIPSHSVGNFLKEAHL